MLVDFEQMIEQHYLLFLIEVKLVYHGCEIPPKVGTKSTLPRRFDTEVFDKIQNEILKLFEDRIKIRDKIKAMDRSLSHSPKRGFSSAEFLQPVVNKHYKAYPTI